jgi:hypothetical protein
VAGDRLAVQGNAVALLELDLDIFGRRSVLGVDRALYT